MRKSIINISKIIKNELHYTNIRNLSRFSVKYDNYGDPIKVLRPEKEEWDESVGPNDILVKMLASSVNPADINMIQGTYPLKPQSLPAVGGNEGVGEVVKIGSNVKSLSKGNWVIPCKQGIFGTWTSHHKGPENHFLKIDNSISLESAVTMSINPCTAYRILKDFVILKPGDTVIQNGANSGVGRAAIQLSKVMGLKTINIVRQRDNLEELKAELIQIGADFVVTEEELRTDTMEKIFKQVPKPRLAFNCVGGKSTTDMMRHLAPKGVVVTFGGMSRQPVIVPTAALIFKDISIRGFWLSRYNDQNTFNPERLEMVEFITNAVKNGHLKPPNCAFLPLEQYQEAIENAMTPFINKKYVFQMN